MKLSKVIAASFAIASLTALPVVLPASAQNDGSGRSTTTDLNRSTNNNSYQNDRRDHDNWGLLGLLGLVGLAGLRKPKHEVTRRYDNADVTSRSN